MENQCEKLELVKIWDWKIGVKNSSLKMKKKNGQMCEKNLESVKIFSRSEKQ